MEIEDDTYMTPEELAAEIVTYAVDGAPEDRQAEFLRAVAAELVRFADSIARA